MFPVATKAGGDCTARVDVCRVPPQMIPTPFVNVAFCRDASGTSAQVLACNKEVLVESSEIPMSTGNEPGSGGGVISGIIKGPCTFRSYSSRVYAEGKKVVILSSTTGQNGKCANALGNQSSPSQTKVLAGA